MMNMLFLCRGGAIGLFAFGATACSSNNSSSVTGGSVASSSGGSVGAGGTSLSTAEHATAGNATLSAGGSTAAGNTATSSGGRSSATGGVTSQDTSGTTVTGAHCSPGQSMTYPYPESTVVYCFEPPYGNPWKQEMPNAEAISSVATYSLPLPLVAGAKNALSFDVSGNAPYGYEIWGTDDTCGHAQELLWYAPTANGVLCAEFTPSKAYSKLLFVYREMYDKHNWAGGGSTITLCPGGSCPAGTYGTGKTDTPLTAPLGNYALTRFNRFAYGYVWDITLGVHGNMLALRDGDPQASGTPQPISGVFRMPQTDPFGDSWYCMGTGSTFTEVADGSVSRDHVNFSLRGITRLGNCTQSAGSNALSATLTGGLGTVTGAPAQYVGSELQAINFRCEHTSCYFSLMGSTAYEFVYLQNSGDTGDYSTPTHATVPVTEAAWFLQTDRMQPMQMVCAASGTLVYESDSAATTHFELSNVSNQVSCPGTPIANDQLDFVAD